MRQGALVLVSRSTLILASSKVIPFLLSSDLNGCTVSVNGCFYDGCLSVSKRGNM